MSHSAYAFLSSVGASDGRSAKDRETGKGNMMQQILVIGGAGRLGRLVVKHLSQAGYCVRGMSRRASPGEDWPGMEWKQADLKTGEGIEAAVEGTEIIVYCAGSANAKSDKKMAMNLLQAASRAGVQHLVFISIVGIDRVPWAGGKSRLANEDLIEHSGIPWSILRATQFHYGIDFLLNFLARLPLMLFMPTDLLLQPVDEEEVARRLVEIVRIGPSGRLPDMGGPQVYTSGELARIWLQQREVHRAIIPIFLPGKMASRLRQGGNTCPQQATGTVSWEAWLQQHKRTAHLG
jgi:uncharacterized protein YbjT (DUF2867 family)